MLILATIYPRTDDTDGSIGGTPCRTSTHSWRIHKKFYDLKYFVFLWEKHFSLALDRKFWLNIKIYVIVGNHYKATCEPVSNECSYSWMRKSVCHVPVNPGQEKDGHIRQVLNSNVSSLHPPPSFFIIFLDKPPAGERICDCLSNSFLLLQLELLALNGK